MTTATRRLLTMLSSVALAAGALLIPAAPATAAGEADALYTLLNDARWAEGQNGLLRNGGLDQVAADWAAHLAASGTLSHNPDYASQIPGGWSNCGENVAEGQPDAGSVHAAWMASAGHRANILGPYTDVGIAFLVAGGSSWSVQVFATYPGHTGPPATGSGAVAGSQVAETPAPGEEATAVVSSPTPTVPALAAETSPEPVAPVAVAAGEVPAGPPSWTAFAIGLMVMATAIAGAVIVRRRRVAISGR